MLSSPSRLIWALSRAMIRRTLGANWPSLEWLFDLRRLIEPLIAGRAAERRTEEDVEATGSLEDSPGA